MKPVIMFSMYGITSALDATHRSLPPPSNRKWIGKNSVQRAVVATTAALRNEHKDVPNLKQSVDISNGGFRLKSDFRVILEWLKKGNSVKLNTGPGVELTSGFTILNSNVVVIETKNRDRVWLIRGVMSRNPLALHSACVSLYDRLFEGGRSNLGYTAIQFPKISIQKEYHWKFLDGLVMDSSRATVPPVDDTIQDISFSMDKVGARAQVKTTLLLKSFSKKWILDEPFTVFFTRNKLSEPYFVAAFE